MGQGPAIHQQKQTEHRQILHLDYGRAQLIKPIELKKEKMDKDQTAPEINWLIRHICYDRDAGQELYLV